MEQEQPTLLSLFANTLEQLQKLWPALTLIVVVTDILFVVGRFWYFGYQSLGVFTFADYWISGWIFLPLVFATCVYMVTHASILTPKAAGLPKPARTESAEPEPRNASQPSKQALNILFGLLVTISTIAWAVSILWNDPSYTLQACIGSFVSCVLMSEFVRRIRPVSVLAVVMCYLASAITAPFAFGKLLGGSDFDSPPVHEIAFRNAASKCVRVVQLAERGVFAIDSGRPVFYRWDDIESVSRVSYVGVGTIRLDRLGLRFAPLPTCKAPAKTS